jgi:hypothetical protein
MLINLLSVKLLFMQVFMMMNKEDHSFLLLLMVCHSIKDLTKILCHLSVMDLLLDLSLSVPPLQFKPTVNVLMSLLWINSKDQLEQYSQSHVQKIALKSKHKKYMEIFSILMIHKFVLPVFMLELCLMKEENLNSELKKD